MINSVSFPSFTEFFEESVFHQVGEFLVMSEGAVDKRHWYKIITRAVG